jgi:hypothetical protein
VPAELVPSSSSVEQASGASNVVVEDTPLPSLKPNSNADSQTVAASSSNVISSDSSSSVDVDRAALTWQDHEITGHDPTDPDDDGEGMNGIGFKPTSAIEYIRMERRKQQIADYRSREARDARARRSERRRAGSSVKFGEKRDGESSRKVRFLDSIA